ncbi:hypothetical protein DJ71_00680, partial [Halorubrum sp. E3]
VVVPIGGGGLISGVAVAIKAQLPDVRVVGVQAEGAASAAKSLEAGEVTEIDSVDTIADGIATRSVGEETLEVMAEYVDEVVTVDDREIALALTLLLERAKTLVEGAGAVALAAVDCLNGGNPEKPDVYGSFEGIVDGLADACSALDTPVVGGNVSLYNDSVERGRLRAPARRRR